MFKTVLTVFVLTLLMASIQAKAAIWQSIDTSITINNPLDAIPADPKTYTINVTNTSANNYSNIYFIIPFHWIVDKIPATAATASTWDNANAEWDNGSASLKITNAAFLTKMSDTDLSMSWPMSINEPWTLANPATINGSDSVPNIYVGNLNSMQSTSFNVVIDFNPGFVVSEFAGYFVIVPEPASIGLLAISAVGLLFRRK